MSSARPGLVKRVRQALEIGNLRPLGLIGEQPVGLPHLDQHRDKGAEDGDDAEGLGEIVDVFEGHFALAPGIGPMPRKAGPGSASIPSISATKAAVARMTHVLCCVWIAR
jgi:hypothetical protein